MCAPRPVPTGRTETRALCRALCCRGLLHFHGSRGVAEQAVVGATAGCTTPATGHEAGGLGTSAEKREIRWFPASPIRFALPSVARCAPVEQGNSYLRKTSGRLQLRLFVIQSALHFTPAAQPFDWSQERRLQPLACGLGSKSGGSSATACPSHSTTG